MTKARDHGGGIDAAAKIYGGRREDWIDLSTGINPSPYPIGQIDPNSWDALPDMGQTARLIESARAFWNVPDAAGILPVPGCSAAIAQIPFLKKPGSFHIPEPTYNEHRASFEYAGWEFTLENPDARIIVHPNNPTGEFHSSAPDAGVTIIDESFCDISPEKTLIQSAQDPNVLVLKSFGKFWGLAGLRLGFVIGDPQLLLDLKNRLGPWAVSGPALQIGFQALEDHVWAAQTRATLKKNAARLDALMGTISDETVGDISLFRTYHVDDAKALHEKLAEQRILTRIFPYSKNWIRFGIPGPAHWDRLENAL